MNGLSLAFLGDAYYELWVRKYLLSLGYTKVDQLHKLKVKLTSSKAQEFMMSHFLENNLLTLEEQEAYKKGRNAAHFSRKNLSIVTYQQATGFESLVGYLSMKDEQRLEELIKIGVSLIKLG
ncbi:ribonuclease III [Acholeplasma equirhinis]|uniref:Mini-ribonuclease 3 n=1 Tax=Acholeplasma equirhinis TaxID=555393 RepID=UPI00197A8B33|nr:ribonuclease III domain-containing protein [Acholeplasma equirhinis]MBN3490900.1 ribonuclease III [Acholeplasma equirhinis]